jgi:hypothetical protein
LALRRCTALGTDFGVMLVVFVVFTAIAAKLYPQLAR